MHNFPQNFTIICKDKLTLKEKKEIFHLCIDNNLAVYSLLVEDPMDKEYPLICFDKDDNTICGYTEDEELDFNEIAVSKEEFKLFIQGKGKYEKPFNESLILSSNYTAVVTKNHVKVGCQTFTHQKIKELYNLSVKAQKSKV